LEGNQEKVFVEDDLKLYSDNKKYGPQICKIIKKATGDFLWNRYNTTLYNNIDNKNKEKPAKNFILKFSPTNPNIIAVLIHYKPDLDVSTTINRQRSENSTILNQN